MLGEYVGRIYDEVKQRLEFSHASVTFFLQYSGSISATIGFKKITQSTSSVLKSVYPLEFKGCPYVMLKIPQLHRFDSVDGNSTIRDSFALIPLNKEFDWK